MKYSLHNLDYQFADKILLTYWHDILGFDQVITIYHLIYIYTQMIPSEIIAIDWSPILYLLF